MSAVPYFDYVAILVHRVLAQHRSGEECLACPYATCWHCQHFGPKGRDHTCPCPYSDADCPDHSGGTV